MNTVRFGQWKIEVDIEKTREYYSQYQINDTQIQRNFIKYCQTLSAEERAFFDSLGIDPACCEADSSFGVSSKGELPYNGFYYVCGKYLSFPEFKAISAQELADNNYVDPRPDPRVSVGEFIFTFACPSHPQSYIPDDIPAGFICIHFCCEKALWVLDEPCENIMDPLTEKFLYGQLTSEEMEGIMSTIGSYTTVNKQKNIEANEEIFSENDISRELMTDEEFLSYKEEWVKHFAPADADMDRVRELCVTREKYSTYLWHLFSFEIAHAVSGDEAVEKFNSILRGECVLVSSWDDLCYRIPDGAKLTPRVLENFVDVVLTAADFSWTYAQTHEIEFGPYYFEKE